MGVEMTSTSSAYVSVRLTQSLMKVNGFWNVETKRKRLYLRINLIYSTSVILLSLFLEVTSLYYCRHDLYEFTFSATSTIPLILVLIKIITFSIRKEDVMWLIKCAQDNFWCKKCNAYEKRILDELNKKALLLMCSFTLLIYAADLMYIVIALVENVGKNETDRILPFSLRLFHIPTSMSPYYEVLFVTEIFCALQAGISITSFDNFLCMLCLHVSGQFKILQHNLETLLVRDLSNEKPYKVHRDFKNYIKHHRLLIKCMEKMERTFCYPVMCQLLISSLLLCISGFQLTLFYGSFLKQLLFSVYFMGGLLQIYFITLNSDRIMSESKRIGDAIYMCNWETASYKMYKELRKNIIIVMMRSQHPCYITAGKFFPVTLESFMKVLSATASYLTLLRQMVNSEV